MEEIYHIPAMLKETIEGLAIKPNGVYVDVTFGGGGHSRAILNNLTPTLSTREGDKLDWSPTVRPPRLGGNKRMGVFATRSPFRPNPICLSSVKLIRVENGELIVSGADVLDGTPIYDIKPYLSFSDSHPDAKNGFAEETKDYELEIVWTNLPITDQEKADLEYILRQDPRPGYQDNPERVYKMDYAGLRVSFRVEGLKVFVLNCERL